ncbi:MAG: efflux RND transporter permease subunit [Brumimicrobium sp.]|nr:efflux RND transporter permease subunit [Brumimicrobium sp.]
MKRVIQFFIERPIWTNAAIALVLMFGLWSLLNLNRSFFPELDPNRIIISTFYPGASPDEMEEGVSIKIEQAVKGLKGIEHIDVTSQENSSQITVSAFQDADMEELLSDVENAVNSISSFPQGAEKPVITRLKTGDMSSNVAFVGVTSINPSKTTKTDLTEMANKVERDLLNTKVITQIEKQGFPENEIVVSIREADLLRYQLTLEQVAAAITLKNNDITAGIIRGGNQEMNIRANSRETDPDEIGDIIVRTTPSGQKIRISDVANVRLDFAEGSQEARFNNKPSVSLQIKKTADEDISAISEAIKKYKTAFNKEHDDYSFEIYFEFNSMLQDRINLLSENGIFGLILVLLALGLFLNIKLSAWVAFGIPFSFLGMFILGIWYGMTINMISLFGMILVVGILVDDGIVIAENIYSHFEKGKSAPRAALEGTMEVLPSVFTSVLTTILAFSVLLFVEGLEMMREMAFVVIACLSFSLLEAFFILPAHLSSKKVLAPNKSPKYGLLTGIIFMLLGIGIIYLGTLMISSDSGAIFLAFVIILLGALLCYLGFASSPIEQKVRNGAERIIRAIRDVVFKDILDFFTSEFRIFRLKIFAIKRVAFFIPMVFVITTIVLLQKGKIGATFFPNIPPDFFNIEVAFNPGDPKEKTREFINTASRVLQEENEKIARESGDTLLSYYTSTVGASMNLGQFGNHVGMINVYYQTADEGVPVDTFMNRIISRLKSLPEGKLAGDLFVGGFNRFGADIEFGLSSEDAKELSAARDKFKSELNNMRGVQNVKDNSPDGRREIHITLHPQAEIYGIGKAEVLNQVRNGFFGREAQRVIIGTDEVKIWVRYPEEDRNSIEDLRSMRITTPAGISVPLYQIAEFKMGRGPESLKRRDGKRQIKVDARAVFPDSIAVLNTRISEKIIPKLKAVYPTVEFEKMGQFERSQKTGNSMMYMTLIVLVAIIIVISLHFSSLFQAFLILLVIPAGIAGAILGHGIVGIPVSMLSAFGMIALLGVLVNDAVVFLDKYNSLILEGLNSREATLQAAIARFRPILLTTITTVAGLLPLIAEKSMQAQFLIPMAVSIAFGVLFGTLFILAFFPAAILFGNDLKRLMIYFWKGKKPAEQDVETALINQREIQEKELK